MDDVECVVVVAPLRACGWVWEWDRDVVRRALAARAVGHPGSHRIVTRIDPNQFPDSSEIPEKSPPESESVPDREKPDPNPKPGKTAGYPKKIPDFSYIYSVGRSVRNYPFRLHPTSVYV